MRKHLFLICLILISVFTLFVSVSPTLAFNSGSTDIIARFGGGEDFDDGGFDSDIDFGGDSGSSIDFGDSDFGTGAGSTNFNPGSVGTGGGCCTFIVFLVIIVAVVIFVIAKNKKNAGSGKSTSTSAKKTSKQDIKASTTSITNKTMSSEKIEENIKKIKEKDSDFDMQDLKSYVKKVFMSCQDAWTKRDLSLCRPFISEDIYQSYKMYVDQMIKNKKINVLENVVVGSVEPVRIELSKNYDRVTFKIRASMKDYKVNEDSPKKVISGDKSKSKTFTEYWVFMRKSGVETKVEDGFFDRKCPNCGAPIDVDVAGKCKYCDANVVNGDYDWVVDEIVQKSEWEE